MNSQRDFQAFSLEHWIAIVLTIALPFALAALVRRAGPPRLERTIVVLILGALLANYLGYMLFLQHLGQHRFKEMLPMQMCDWAMAVIFVALWTGWPRWFEVAYFWGIGGTLQAILTPNLHYAFPDTRCISFFVGHSGIIVAVVFLMLTRRLRPHPISILRAFFWSEIYFVCALAVDQITGVNYGYLLHKPDTFSLLSYLSDSRLLYLLEFQLLALVFFIALYIPFAIADAFHASRKID